MPHIYYCTCNEPVEATEDPYCPEHDGGLQCTCDEVIDAAANHYCPVHDESNYRPEKFLSKSAADN